jgi:hypothetical protein
MTSADDRDGGEREYLWITAQPKQGRRIEDLAETFGTGLIGIGEKLGAGFGECIELLIGSRAWPSAINCTRSTGNSKASRSVRPRSRTFAADPQRSTARKIRRGPKCGVRVKANQAMRSSVIAAMESSFGIAAVVMRGL